MKKLVVVLLITLLATSPVIAYGESTNLVPFEPNITKTLNFTADQIMASSFLRASVTVFLALDLSLAVNNDGRTPNLEEASFVGKSDGLIYIYAYTRDNTSVCIGYLPSQEYAVYSIIDGWLPISHVKMVMSEQCTDGYYKNDSDDIDDVIAEVNRILEG